MRPDRRKGISVAISPTLLEARGFAISIRFGFDPNFDGSKRGTLPIVPTIARYAIIDTGGAHCAVNATLAHNLGLPIIGTKKIAGIHGVGETDVCRAHIVIPEFNYGFEGKLLLSKLSDGIDAIIGRSLLRHFCVIYNGATGEASLLLTPRNHP